MHTRNFKCSVILLCGNKFELWLLVLNVLNVDQLSFTRFMIRRVSLSFGFSDASGVLLPGEV